MADEVEHDDHLDDFMEYIFDNPYDYMPRRYIRDRQNPVDYYSEGEFMTRYRFSKRTVIDVLIPMILMPNANNRGLPVPPIIKLLTALRFFATGSFQLVCADLRQVAQPTVSQIVKCVSVELAAKLPLWVKRPSTEEEYAAIRNSFYATANFPGVVGCIDCTHIPIKSPGGELAEVYRNRKGWFSMNVQVVVGPSMEIMDIVCRWPGSVHDARILHNSRLKHRFETGQMRGILLGDSGYPLLPYLFTPVLRPTTGPERRYNTSHIRTRSIVERTFGIWKRRFPCLSTKLRTKLSTSLKVILACAVLHNVAVRHHAPVPEQEHVMPMVVVPVHEYRGHNGRGAAERAALIQRHFAELNDLSRVGGKDETALVNGIHCRLMTNSFARLCSWKGQRGGKYTLDSTPFLKLVHGAAIRNTGFGSMTEEVVKDRIQKWLKQASRRKTAAARTLAEEPMIVQENEGSDADGSAAEDWMQWVEVQE